MFNLYQSVDRCDEGCKYYNSDESSISQILPSPKCVKSLLSRTFLNESNNPSATCDAWQHGQNLANLLPVFAYATRLGAKALYRP